jgi:hypothetical protein
MDRPITHKQLEAGRKAWAETGYDNTFYGLADEIVDRFVCAIYRAMVEAEASGIESGRTAKPDST